MATLSVEEKINKYIKYIPNIINKCRLERYMPYDDLYSIGLEALWKSILKYKPERGSQSTIAYLMIKQSMVSECMKIVNNIHREITIDFSNIDNDENDKPNYQFGLEDKISLLYCLDEYRLSTKDKKILKMLLEGHKKSIIARKLKTNYYTVLSSIERIRRQIYG